MHRHGDIARYLSRYLARYLSRYLARCLSIVTLGLAAGCGAPLPDDFAAAAASTTLTIPEERVVYQKKPGDKTCSCVEPWIYDPNHTGIVSAAWQGGAGAPGTGEGHGLVFAKQGATSVAAAAGAEISCLHGRDAASLVLGYDYRGELHCGAGAPRFNVETNDGVTHFIGCHYGVHSTLPGSTWRRVTFSAADAVPPLGSGSVRRVYLVFDEGTDTPVANRVVTPGRAVLDNVRAGDRTYLGPVAPPDAKPGKGCTLPKH